MMEMCLQTERLVNVSKGQGKARQSINILHLSWQVSKDTVMLDLHRLKNKGDGESEGVNLNNMMNETSIHLGL